MQTNVYGKRSEIIAADYLKKKGYKILETNYKNKVGEIDVIAKDKDYIVFVEVKARMSQAFGHPFEAVFEPIHMAHVQKATKNSCSCVTLYG